MIFAGLQMIEFVLGILLVVPELPEKKSKRILFWLGLLIAAGLYSYNGLLFRISTALVLFMPFITAVLLWLLSRIKILHVYLWNFVFTGIVSLIKLGELIILGMLRKQNIVEINYGKADIFDVIFELVLVGVLAGVWVRTHRKATILADMIQKNRLLMFSLGFIEYEMMSYIMLLGFEQISDTMLVLTCITIVSIIAILLTVMFSIVYGYEKMEYRLIQQKQERIEQYYSQMKDTYERIARINHNIKHERTYLYQSLKRGDVEQAITYLEGQEAGMKNITNWTGHSSIDFIVDIKNQEMRSKDIVFTIESDYEEIPVPDSEFYLLFGLLLENAIEAAEQCVNGEKWIKVSLIKRNNLFMLHIRNSSNHNPVKKNGRFLSTKSDTGIHGWGLKSVELLVEKYEGTVKYDFASKYFDVRIVFWNNQQERKMEEEQGGKSNR